ncbi:hypothetical protein [Parasitella parasitica]|uniref:RRM domain-containing protein n=1 Tax=Parasitella parasitica TaxID=35722 RepID=A0A0B7NLT9_9FUNG|nr:hypothetical protein [Parasitella parasitica]
MSRTLGSHCSSELHPTSNDSLPIDSVERPRAETMPSCVIPLLRSFSNLDTYIAQQKPSHDIINPVSKNIPMPSHLNKAIPLNEDVPNSLTSTLASLESNRNEYQKTGNTTWDYQGLLRSVTHDRGLMTLSRTTMPVNNNEGANNNMPLVPFSWLHLKLTCRPYASSLGTVDSLSTPPCQLPFSAIGKFSGQRNLCSDESLLEEECCRHHQHEPSGVEPPAETLSRALWLGGVNPSVSVSGLHKMFARYGRIEGVRILYDKKCAFVNFDTVASALAAKEDLVGRLGRKVAGSKVKVGFGKADVNAGPKAQGPTRALWVGNIPSSTNPANLLSLFETFGAIESVRILPGKNCAFVNFERQQDAVIARKQLQYKKILGSGTAAVRIGFAKVPNTTVYNPLDYPTSSH